MHRAQEGREPAPRRCSRANSPQGRDNKVLDDSELVPGQRRGRGWYLQLRHQEGKVCGTELPYIVDTGRDGLGNDMEIPELYLEGDGSVGEFYSVALTNRRQQADTGTKMIHIGKNTSSTIVSKGISAGHGQNTYRGLVQIGKDASGARNYTQCDSMLIGDKCGAHTFPYIEVKNSTAQMEHEASTSKIGEDQIFYCQQRGLSAENAVSLIVNGFCREVFKELPFELAIEAEKLLSISLEGRDRK